MDIDLQYRPSDQNTDTGTQSVMTFEQCLEPYSCTRGMPLIETLKWVLRVKNFSSYVPHRPKAEIGHTRRYGHCLTKEDASSWAYRVIFDTKISSTQRKRMMTMCAGLSRHGVIQMTNDWVWVNRIGYLAHS